MTTIKFSGWEVGMKKISFIKTLNEYGVRLKTAKDIKEKIMNNEAVYLEIEDEEKARKLVEISTQLGIKCEIVY